MGRGQGARFLSQTRLIRWSKVTCYGNSYSQRQTQPHPGPLCLRLSWEGLRAEGSAGLPSSVPSLPAPCRPAPLPPPPVGTLSDCGLHVPLRRAGMKRAGARQWGPVVLITRSFGSWWDRRVSRAFLLSLSLSLHHPLSLLHAPPSPLGTLHFHCIPSMSPSWPADPRGPGSLLLCRCWEQRGTC